MGVRGWLIFGAVAYAIFNAARPTWYADLMNRAYADDHLVSSSGVSPSVWQNASIAAAIVGMPIGWLLDIASKVQPGDVEIIAQKLKNAVLRAGPPPDTLPATLAAYKAKIFAAAGVA